MPKEKIAYQNKDIISKIFAERIRNKSLRVYGLDVPDIVRALPTNLPAIEANELRMDNLFLLADGSLAIIDYESVYREENKIKYLGYESRVIERYYKENRKFPRLRIIIIYTADVTRRQTESMLDTGNLQLNIMEAFLSELPSDKIKKILREKIKHGIALTEEEMMEFIILPLSYKGREAQRTEIKKSVNLVTYIQNKETLIFLLSGLLVFTDKVIDEETAAHIRRRISMTKVGMILEEERIHDIKAATKAVRRKAAKETKAATKATARETAERMLMNGKLTVKEIAGCIPGMTVSEVEKIQQEMGKTPSSLD